MGIVVGIVEFLEFVVSGRERGRGRIATTPAVWVLRSVQRWRGGEVSSVGSNNKASDGSVLEDHIPE